MIEGTVYRYKVTIIIEIRESFISLLCAGIARNQAMQHPSKDIKNLVSKENIKIK